MTKVAIVPVATEGGAIAYQASAGHMRSQGATAGQALDALTAQMSEQETGTLVIVQSGRPDRFFGVAQQRRLAELMTQWRELQEQGNDLPTADKAELEALIEAELRAAGARAAALAEELSR